MVATAVHVSWTLTGAHRSSRSARFEGAQAWIIRGVPGSSTAQRSRGARRRANRDPPITRNRASGNKRITLTPVRAGCLCPPPPPRWPPVVPPVVPAVLPPVVPAVVPAVHPPVVPPVVPPAVPPGVHVSRVMMFVSKVTEPLRASARPSMLAPVVTEIDVRARMLPTNVAHERGAGADRGETAHLPEHIARLRTVHQEHPAGRGRGQRRADLEDEDRVGVAARVERQSSREADRGGGLVDARPQPQAPEVPRDRGTGRLAGGGVIGRRQVGLRLRIHRHVRSGAHCHLQRPGGTRAVPQRKPRESAPALLPLGHRTARRRRRDRGTRV